MIVAGLSAVGMTGCGNQADDEEDLVIETPSQTYAALEKSEAEHFNKNDLSVNGVSVMASEEDVTAAFGEPMAQRTSEDGTQKTFFYDQMTLTLIRSQAGYVLEGVRVTGSEWQLARGLKVGSSREDVLGSFYRDEECLNNNLMSQDNETIIGKFLYGEYTLDTLEEYKGKGDVEFGIINYNGYDSMESAQDLTYEYVFMEAPFIGEKPSANDDFAQLNIEVDKNGTITEISWYYYEEIRE